MSTLYPLTAVAAKELQESFKCLAWQVNEQKKTLLFLIHKIIQIKWITYFLICVLKQPFKSTWAVFYRRMRPLTMQVKSLAKIPIPCSYLSQFLNTFLLFLVETVSLNRICVQFAMCLFIKKVTKKSTVNDRSMYHGVLRVLHIDP